MRKGVRLVTERTFFVSKHIVKLVHLGWSSTFQRSYPEKWIVLYALASYIHLHMNLRILLLRLRVRENSCGDLVEREESLVSCKRLLKDYKEKRYGISRLSSCVKRFQMYKLGLVLYLLAGLAAAMITLHTTNRGEYVGKMFQGREVRLEGIQNNFRGKRVG